MDRDLHALGQIEATIAHALEELAPGWSIKPAPTAQPAGPHKFYLVSRDEEELSLLISVVSESSARAGHVHPVPVDHRTLDWGDGTARAFPFIFIEQRVVVNIGVPGESYDYMLPIAEIIRDSIRHVISHCG